MVGDEAREGTLARRQMQIACQREATARKAHLARREGMAGEARLLHAVLELGRREREEIALEAREGVALPGAAGLEGRAVGARLEIGLVLGLRRELGLPGDVGLA